MRHTEEEAAKKEVDLFRGHGGRATPVCPVRLIGLIVVVLWIEVDRGMDEAEDESVGSPIDDNVHGHIVVINCDFFCV
jgi:hypothetical protein